MKYLSFILLFIALNSPANEWNNSLIVGVSKVDDVLLFFKEREMEVGQKYGCPTDFQLDKSLCESGYSILVMFKTNKGPEIEVYFLFNENLTLSKTVVK